MLPAGVPPRNAYQALESPRIGEVLEVPLARPRKRLELATNPGYLKCRQRVLEFLYERHRFVEAA